MKNNMILNCKVPTKILRSLMLVAALLMIIPVSARLQTQGSAPAPRRTTAVSARSRAVQRRSPQGRYAARTRQQQLKQPVKKQTEQKITPPAGGGSSVPAPGSQQVTSTDFGVDAKTWRSLQNTLRQKKTKPTQALEDIKKIRAKGLELSDEQEEWLDMFEGWMQFVQQQKSEQLAGAETAPVEKPQQQQQAQGEQPTAPAGGGPSVSSVRTNPFLATQAPTTEQPVRPVVTTETKPTRQGPIQQAWQNMPSLGEVAYRVTGGSDPNLIQTPQVASQPTQDKPVGQLKQAWRNLPSFSSALYQLGGGSAPDIINPKPQAPAPVTQPQIQPAVAPAQPRPAAISEEQWENVGRNLSAQQPSQELIDTVEGIKKDSRLSDAQRDDLERFQQSIKERLNTSLQTPTPPATIPLVLPRPMPSNPFVAAKVSQVQPPTPDNPFSLPQPQRKTMNENLWKQTKTNLSKSIVAFPSQVLLNRIEELKNTYVLSNEQLQWLSDQQRVIKERLMPLSVPVKQQVVSVVSE